jgi:hypothetical protein
VTEDCAMLLVHPAAYQQAKALFGEAAIDLKDQLGWICLSGPTALHVLCQVLDVTDPQIMALLYEASALNASIFPDGAALGCSVRIAAKSGPMHTPSRAQSVAEPRDDFIPKPLPSNLLSALMNWPAQAGNSVLWSTLEPGKFTAAPTSLTTRSKRARYPKPSTKPAKQARGVEATPQEAPLTQPRVDEHLPIFLTFQKSSLKRGYAASWNLLCPATSTLALWR